MPLAEAEAFTEQSAAMGVKFPETYFQATDTKADVEKLRQLAIACERFTPLFGIEEDESPESLLLDVTGCTHLFGGDQVLAGDIAISFRDRGFQVRVGVAPTIGGAWAMAHFLAKPASPAVVPPSGLPGTLPPLPVESLRLTPNILATLQELGLRTVGQLQTLPRASIPSRFGPLLLKRINQAFGDEPEFFVAEKPLEPLIAEWTGEFPIKDRESLHVICRQLLDQLLDRLKPRREGIRQLGCELRDSRRRPHLFLIEFTAPSDHPRHSFEMLCLQWEQAVLPEEIDFVRLEAVTTGSLKVIQRDLFGHEIGNDGQREVVVLLDRLSNRLGARSVLRAQLLPEAQPELAIAHQPWAGCDSTVPIHKTNVATLFAMRPTRLFSPPEAIQVAVVGPAGAPLSFWWNRREHSVIRSWPERIETGWWRETPASRDYFRVEVQTGHHFWIFHRLDVEQGWFLQGAFD